MTNGRHRQPVGDETPHAVPKEAAILATPRQRAIPEASHLESKEKQRRSVHGHSVIADVSTHHRLQPLAQFRDRFMHAPLKLGFPLVQLRLQSFAYGLPQHPIHSIASLLHADGRKAEEVESFRFPFSASLPVLDRKRTKLQQPRVGRVRWWRGSGLRMMPTFPPPPLSFRTAGFPQYGWKAGLSGSALRRDTPVKPLPGMPIVSRGLRLPFVHFAATPFVSHSVGKVDSIVHRHARDCSLYPRGPRSGLGSAVPVHHRLLGLIRPTRRHIATSPLGGLYAMPSLCGCALATHEWFRAFTDRSFSTCRPLRPRGVHRLHAPSSFVDGAGLRPLVTASALPSSTPSASSGPRISGLYWFASL